MLDEREKENALPTPVKPTSISTIESESIDGEQSVNITEEGGEEERNVGIRGTGSETIIQQERRREELRKRSRRSSRRRSSLSFVEESINTSSSNSPETPSKPGVLNVKAPQITYTPVRKRQLASSSFPSIQQQQQQQQQPMLFPVSQIQQQVKNLFFKRRRKMRTADSPQKRRAMIDASSIEIDYMGREMEQSDLAAPKSALEETFDYYDTHCADLINSVDISGIGAGCAVSANDKLSLGKAEQEQELELEGESFIDPEYDI